MALDVRHLDVRHLVPVPPCRMSASADIAETRMQLWSIDPEDYYGVDISRAGNFTHEYFDLGDLSEIFTVPRDEELIASLAVGIVRCRPALAKYLRRLALREITTKDAEKVKRGKTLICMVSKLEDGTSKGLTDALSYLCSVAIDVRAGKCTRVHTAWAYDAYVGIAMWCVSKRGKMDRFFSPDAYRGKWTATEIESARALAEAYADKFKTEVAGEEDDTAESDDK